MAEEPSPFGWYSKGNLLASRAYTPSRVWRTTPLWPLGGPKEPPGATMVVVKEDSVNRIPTPLKRCISGPTRWLWVI